MLLRAPCRCALITPSGNIHYYTVNGLEMSRERMDLFRKEWLCETAGGRGTMKCIGISPNIDKFSENDIRKPLSPLACTCLFVIYSYLDSYGSGLSAAIGILHPI